MMHNNLRTILNIKKNTYIFTYIRYLDKFPSVMHKNYFIVFLTCINIAINLMVGDSTQLDLDGLLYIGGVGAPFAPLTVPPVLWTGALRQGYVGCMRDLVINGNPIDIAGYAQQQDSGK